MADTERDSASSARPAVAETVVDIPETVIGSDLRPALLSGDITFDATTAAGSEGRMAECARSLTFTIHANDVIGSGSQGMVVRATDSAGAQYAAKISYPVATARDRRNRKAVLESLVSLMDEHPLGANHYKQTHLMPVYAYGKISGPDGSGSQQYDVAIMALCDSNLDDAQGCSYDEIRRTVLPQAAEGLRFLHVQGIVHRDVKPKNLYMLDGSIVLGDYGISSLLDEGKDTGATVFDKRTPGYSPHSSVVQRENDWYALGYTIWTLYNNGVHPHQALIDAGDLSAVLAGKHPVEFIPRNPNESTLGDLIYGLTLESPRGRLGYDAIQEWLDDPAAFRFENPYDAAEGAKRYQFNGVTYTDNAKLAEAMAKHWEEAREHIRSGALEDHLKASGQQDLAVRVHRAMDEGASWGDTEYGIASAITVLRGSRDEFAWHGEWRNRAAIGDEAFARLAAEPYALYEFASDPQKVRELLRFFLVAYAGVPAFAREEAVVRAAYNSILGMDGSDVILRVDNMLCLLEVLCADKAAVRRFFLDYGPFGDAVWVKRNIGFYVGDAQGAKKVVRKVRDMRLPSPESETIEQIRASLQSLAVAENPLFAMLPRNPYEGILGIQGESAISIGSTDAYRVASAYGETCTLGYARMIVDPSKLDGVCDFQALREVAVDRAHAKASDIRATAQTDVATTVEGHSKFWHVVLMGCLLVVLWFAWDSFGSLQAEYMEGFETYSPAVEAADGIVPDAWLSGTASPAVDKNPQIDVSQLAPAARPPEGYVAEEAASVSVATGDAAASFNSCSAGLDLSLLGFTLAVLGILVIRLMQLIPVAFAASFKRRAERAADRLDGNADRLASVPLAQSIDDLFASKQLGSHVNASAHELDTSEHSPLMRTKRLGRTFYRIGLVAVMVGTVLATVTWVPMALAGVDASTILASGPYTMVFGQGSLIFTLAVYYAIVLRIGRWRYNIWVVLFVAAPLPFFAWFSVGKLFSFMQYAAMM